MASLKEICKHEKDVIIGSSAIVYGFIYIEGGVVQLGTNNPLKGGVEGYRKNETPVRLREITPFWLGIRKVTNIEFEQFFPKHRRSPHSLDDNHPVVDVTYNEVSEYINRLNSYANGTYRLPTEIEWTYAASPFGQEYPHGDTPSFEGGHVYGDGHEFGCAPVFDERWARNHLGLDQMGYNVSELTQDIHTIPGTFDSSSDGTYCIVKGGNWGRCILSPSVHRRRIFDVIDRNPRVGFRLACNV